jgi:O-acetyl-ADP-ribose deacetylase (regulator of RNase III)
MYLYRRTSLLESSAQTLVNTVNCVGVMGKGIAKDFNAREPEMFGAYKRLCDNKSLHPGDLWLWRGKLSWIINFATKNHWRHPSKIEWIERGLDKFRSNYARIGVREISFPRLGCGNGGLEWAEVKPLMERYLSDLPINIYVHDYSVDIGIPEHLEPVAAALSKEASGDPSFDGFLNRLERALALSHNELSDIRSNEPIVAQLTDGELRLRTHGGEWQFDTEALRGAWTSLQNGILTREKADWESLSGGEVLLSVLSVLPQLRAIEIQRSNSNEPELAVELRPGGSAAAPDMMEQAELPWG